MVFRYEIPTIQVGWHLTTHMLIMKLAISHTKIKRDIARWIALLILEDVGRNLTSAKLTTQISSRRWSNHHVLLTAPN